MPDNINRALTPAEQAIIASSNIAGQQASKKTGIAFKPYIYTPPPTPDKVVSDSTNARSEYKAVDTDIKNLQSAADRQNDIYVREQERINRLRNETISSINTEYDIAKKAQEVGQERDYASRATQLVTSGGGYLGATQSQQGVLENLRGTFEAEKTALLSKKDAAIQAARNAYDDKNFALAKEMANSAKEVEKEIYNRQKDYANMQLQIASANRAQTEFDLGIAEKKIEAYSTMSDESFGQLTPEQLAETDKLFFPGFTELKRKADKEIALGKTIESDLKLKNSIQTLINKTPQGQKITLADGSTYMGLKKPIGIGSKSGIISPQLAVQLGVPSLAGKDESDVILSLSLENPPAWYREYYKASNPVVYSKIANDPNLLKADWKAFTSQPDINAYKNSSVVSSRIQNSNDILSNIAGLEEALRSGLEE